MTRREPVEIVEHISTLPFNRALERLKKAIVAAGSIVFNTIDHQAGARPTGP